MSDGEVYTIRRKSFWKNSRALLHNEMEIGLLKTNWRGGLSFTIKWENLSHDYVFKRTGIWNQVYFLKDSAGRELFNVQTNFRLKKLAFEYTVESDCISSPEGLEKLLFVLSVYFTNFMISNAASHAAAATS